MATSGTNLNNAPTIGGALPTDGPTPWIRPDGTKMRLDHSGEPVHGGFTRLELEIEFVQALGNPYYLNHLASQKYFSDPRFIRYLNYLQYWLKPPYIKYLTYPGPTIKALRLLQSEQFRKDIINPEFVKTMVEEGKRAAVEWQQKKD